MCFSSYTPIVKGGRLYAEFRANRRVRLYCHLVCTGILHPTPEYDEEDCRGKPINEFAVIYAVVVFVCIQVLEVCLKRKTLILGHTL